MWWPRPRWKSDFLARFVLLLFITVATTTNVVMADEGQHCGGSDMSAIIWTTALCTMLLVLIVVVIYFVYCKKREHDWSSLWWKSNSDKNIVLQTSPPANGQPQKIGGTDNPAFLADSYFVGRVTKTGLNRIVHVSSLNDGSLGAELSIKEEDGRKIFMCKHNDGSKDRLVAVRLVFDKGQQQLCGPSSDLSRALAELSREYGLQVELETEGDAAAATGVDGGVPEKRATRPADILSAVRGTALRLWQQRPLAFKGGDGGDRADDKTKSDGDDVETGRAADAPTGPEQRKPVACTVTTVDETASVVPPPQQQRQKQQQQQPPQTNGDCNGDVGPRRYRTLEYGATPPDATARSSPDSSIQCCVVNSSEPAAKADGGAGGEDAGKVSSGEPTAGVCGESESAAAEARDDYDDDGPKHGNPPPPPPPRKYSASVHVSAAAVPAGGAVAAAHVDPLPVVTVAPTKTAPPTAGHEIRIDDDYYWCTTTAMAAPPMSTFGKRPPATVAGSEDDETPPRGAVVPDGCSGSAAGTAAPVFGGKSAADDHRDVDGGRDEAAATAADDHRDVDGRDKTTTAADDHRDVDGRDKTTTAAADDHRDVDGRDKTATAADDHRDVDGGRDKTATAADDRTDGDALDGDGDRDIAAVAGGGTTSIEDASLPSFSSDEDEEDDDDDDDNAETRDGDGEFVTTGKARFSCGPAVTTNSKDAAVSCGDGEQIGVAAGADGGKGRKPDAKADCNGETRNNDNGVAPAADSRSPTKLPTLRLSLSSPLQSSVTTTSCCSSSASSTSSTSSSPTNNGSNNNNNNNSPIVSKIPVRRQSAGSSSVTSNGGTAVSMSLTNNGSAKKSIPLPLSRSGSRLAMWSSVN